jgi:hypothetical protein
MAGAKPCGEQQTESRFRVLDLASPNHLQSSREWHRLQFEKFIRFMLSLSGRQTGCHEKVNFFVGEAGSRVHRKQLIHAFRRTPRFLFQLPGRAFTGIFSRIQASCWYLVEIALGRVPILPDQKNLRIVSGRVAEKWDHRAGTRMPHHLELTNRPVGKSDGIDVERNDLAGVGATRPYPPGTVFFAAFHSQALWTVTSPRLWSASELLTVAASPTITVCSKSG